MRFTNLQYNNIKGSSGGQELPLRACVFGPNESGKSSLLEAIRLALTGRSSLGSKATQRLLSSPDASAQLTSDDGDCFAWSAPQKHSAAFDAQGAMPITVQDFWELTAKDRMTLVSGGSDTLSQLLARADQLEAEKKRASTIINRPPPVAPDAYDGPAVPVVAEKIQEVQSKLDAHKRSESQEVQVCAARDTLRVSEERYSAARMILDDTVKSESRIVRRLQELEPLCDIQKAAQAGVPNSVKDAIQGQEDLTFLNTLRDDLSQACEWLRSNGCPDRQLGLWKESLDRLSDIEEGEIPAPTHERQGDSSDPEAEKDSLIQELAKVQRERKSLESEIQTLVSSNKACRSILEQEGALQGRKLSMDELESLHLQLDHLQGQRRQSEAWGQYNEAASKDAQERSDALAAKEACEEELAQNLKDRNSEVDRLKGPIQEACNDSLSRCGMPHLSLDIHATAKTAELHCTTDGIHIDALAASRRLLYGLVLLNAIHEASDAPCPVLLGECAEMDEEMFKRATAALSHRSKGNVILEHWHDVPVDWEVFYVDAASAV